MTKTKDQKPKATIVVGLILAAGRSSRMGAFKSLLPFGPKTVIETCIDQLRSGGVDSIVVVVGNDDRAQKLKNHLQNQDVILAVNPNPNSEMNASIAAGVRALPSETRAVVINPVDHAAVPAEVIAQIVAAWKHGALLVKPTCNERGGHPVLLDLRFRKELLNLDPTTGLKGLFHRKQLLVQRLAVDSNLIARDLDTWDDYCVLHQEVFGVPPPKQPF